MEDDLFGLSRIDLKTIKVKTTAQNRAIKRIFRVFDKDQSVPEGDLGRFLTSSVFILLNRDRPSVDIEFDGQWRVRCCAANGCG